MLMILPYLLDCYVNYNIKFLNSTQLFFIQWPYGHPNNNLKSIEDEIRRYIVLPAMANAFDRLDGFKTRRKQLQLSENSIVPFKI